MVVRWSAEARGLIHSNFRFLPLNRLLYPAEVRCPKKGFSLGVGCNGLLNPSMCLDNEERKTCYHGDDGY